MSGFFLNSSEYKKVMHISKCVRSGFFGSDQHEELAKMLIENKTGDELSQIIQTFLFEISKMEHEMLKRQCPRTCNR